MWASDRLARPVATARLARKKPCRLIMVLLLGISVVIAALTGFALKVNLPLTK
jgi:t-SNARE complex subunit (syntaxin)